jgi:hypothetical protein
MCPVKRLTGYMQAEYQDSAIGRRQWIRLLKVLSLPRSFTTCRECGARPDLDLYREVLVLYRERSGEESWGKAEF